MTLVQCTCTNKTIHQIVHVRERAGLLTVSVDLDAFRIEHGVEHHRHHLSFIGADQPRTVAVEGSNNSRIHPLSYGMVNHHLVEVLAGSIGKPLVQ